MVVLWFSNEANFQIKGVRKLIIQGTITILLFLGTWLLLSQIGWVKHFKIQEATDRTEEKLGELIWKELQRTGDENTTPYVLNAVDSIVTHLCDANNIDKEAVRVHILNTKEVNAFALPDGHLVIYSGLIDQSASQEELIGVICHEMAHIELNHVMKKLLKEIGLAVLVSMTTGQGGTEIIKETAKILSSAAFDRSLEREADLKAVDYMIKAKVDPEPFANFLYKLSYEEGELAKYTTWVHTHPDLKERAADIIEYNKNSMTEFSPILSGETWDQLLEEIQE